MQHLNSSDVVEADDAERDLDVVQDPRVAVVDRGVVILAAGQVEGAALAVSCEQVPELGVRDLTLGDVRGEDDRGVR